MLLNVSFFLWIGAVCPWNLFGKNSVIPVYRLIFLGIMVLLFRRLPFVMLIHKRIYQIEEMRQALFVGYFGPIGVSAIFYLYIALDWLEENIKLGEEEHPEAQRLGDVLTVVVWFLVVCSIVRRPHFLLKANPPQLVHGLSIPLGKLGLYLPRTLSRAITQDERSHSSVRSPPHLPGFGIHSIPSTSSPRSVYTPRMGPPTLPSSLAAAPVAASAPAAVGSTSVQRPGALRQLGRVGRAVARSLGAGGSGGSGVESASTNTPRSLPSSSTLGFVAAAPGLGHPSRSAGVSSSNISDALGASARLGVAVANAADAAATTAAAAADENGPSRTREPYFARTIRFPG